jgi:hypothetical protein
MRPMSGRIERSLSACMRLVSHLSCLKEDTGEMRFVEGREICLRNDIKGILIRQEGED